jgi:hypothetical protein
MSRAKTIELDVEYDDELNPVSGRCSACREKMPRLIAKDPTPDVVARWLIVQFEIHRRRKHRAEAVAA